MFSGLKTNLLPFKAMIVVLVWVPHCDGWQRPTVTPSSIGLDSKSLDEIDVLMQQGITEGKIVGCSAMILKDDQIGYFNTWGSRDREKKLPLQRDTIFRIYSMTKPIASIAAMQLVEQGKIDLDAPISNYLPQLADRKVLVETIVGTEQPLKEVAADREITPRDLMRHTSGLTFGLFKTTAANRRFRSAKPVASLEQMVDRLADMPLKTQPGVKFEYGISTDVLARLVEVVSNERFDRYLHKHIFEPLKMTDTFFNVPVDKQQRLAQLYSPGPGNELVVAGRLQSRRFLNPDNLFFSGGGGLCSTADDYMQFCRMLLGNGSLDGKQIVRPETLDQMFTNQLGNLQEAPKRFRFGLGFSISPQGDYSWGGAAGTRFMVNPDKKLAVIYMIQISPYRHSYGAKLREIAYRAAR